MRQLSENIRTLWRRIVLARHVKDLFLDGGQLKRSGEVYLADLRNFCFADRGTIFSTEPLEMARREGRREVFVRTINLLNLDEEAVLNLMELDDGYGQ